jgi:catechol 2,3-dioxygenase-like lactoylglutathione lyase family enzyme
VVLQQAGQRWNGRVKDIDNINHVGMAVRELAVTVARYEAMGFQLTPYSEHSGAWKPGEKVQSFRSGNRCVMFANSYLEILASTDPSQPSPRIEGYLNHHEGAHIICFNAEDVHALDQRLRGAGVATSGVIPLQREIDTPEGNRLARFERTQFAPDDSPEGYIQAARHLTPEYIYQRRYVQHPNKCEQLSEVIVVADDLEHFVGKYRRCLDALPERSGPTARFRFPLGSTLTLVEPRYAAAMLPGTLFPPLPGIAAVAFRTPDLRWLRDQLIARGFALGELKDRLIVAAEQASGVAVVFEN